MELLCELLHPDRAIPDETMEFVTGAVLNMVNDGDGTLNDKIGNHVLV